MHPFYRGQAFNARHAKGADMSKGYVYVLSNPAMPGLLKIGMTTGCVDARATQLSSTGVPLDFVVEARYKCSDCADFERFVHTSLSEYRFNDKKEFFKIDVGAAKSKISSMHADYLARWVEEFAEQCTLVESEAFVDPSHIYFLSDCANEDIFLIVQAMQDLTLDEIRPALERVKNRAAKWSAQ